MILIGTGVHNFCDGVVIAASFLADIRLGLATTVAIVAHAVPQQVGDFAVLLHSGFTRPRAFAYNVSAGFATLVGALAGYFALAQMQQMLPTVLAIAAASLLYVAVADLIPEPASPPGAARDREAGAADRPRHCGHLRRARGARALTAAYASTRRGVQALGRNPCVTLRPRSRRARDRRIAIAK